MYASKLRAASIALASSLALAACAGPYGGVGIGYGSGGYYGGYGGYGGYYGGYDSYGYPYSSYGYGPSGYAYYPSGSWYNDYYYPGTGYYVYSRTGTRQRWSDAQRRYWESHRGDHRDRVIRTQTQTQVTEPSRWQHRDRRGDSVTSATTNTTTRQRGSWTGRHQMSSDGTTTRSDSRRGRRHRDND